MTETETGQPFALTEEQSMLQETVRRFADEQLIPRAMDLDSGSQWPEASWSEMAELGLAGVSVPEELGGAGMDLRSTSITYDELARGCGSTAAALLAHLSVCASTIARFGGDALKASILPSLCDGTQVGGGTLAPAWLRGDVPEAESSGDGWRLRGELHGVMNASRADLFVVPARDAASNEVAFYVVERTAPGVSIGAPSESLGLRGGGRGTLQLANASVDASHRLDVDPTSTPLRASIDLDVASVAIGLATSAFRRAVRYAHERVTFGKPIAKHQAIRFKLAEAGGAITMARQSLDHALHTNGFVADRVSAALARYQAVCAAERVGFDAIQVHGGYGYSSEYEVERMWRDARTVAECEGSQDDMREALAVGLLEK